METRFAVPKRILITGMSGTGKSTVISELKKRGHHAIDLDADGWSAWTPCEGDPTGANPGHDWVWNERKLADLLDQHMKGLLFIAGCAPNMGRFTGSFDRIILLSAPIEILLERVAMRRDNPYGKSPAEAKRIVENLREIEPTLRRVATHEVDAKQPFERVLEEVLRVAK